jgi:hypothetical protein
LKTPVTTNSSSFRALSFSGVLAGAAGAVWARKTGGSKRANTRAVEYRNGETRGRGRVRSMGKG